MGVQWMQAIAFEGNVKTFETPSSFAFETKMKLKREDGWAGICVGLANKTGYGLLVNVKLQEAHFMKLRGNAVWLDQGMRRMTLRTGEWYGVRAEYDGEILKLYLLTNPLDEDPWPVFEFPVQLEANVVACEAGADAAEFANAKVEAWQPEAAAQETFTNPVMVGADPDILLHEGRYYLYNRVPNDPKATEDAYLYNGSKLAQLDDAGDENAIFRVTSSPDLVHWSAYKTVFFRDETLAGAFCMSPNVVEKDGWFYLFFAAGRFRGAEDFHVYCASSHSPEGPFTLRSLDPIHPDFLEIGGMPFVDDDGTVYLSLVRFDRGNHIWVTRVHLEDGVARVDEAAAVKLLSPEADYEIDEYGRIVEGGVFIKHKGLYYMIYADGHYKGHYGESCAVSESIYGPYVRQKNNPILHHHYMANGTGDGIVIYNQDKSEMYMGYHRHVSMDTVEPRVTCVDRMKFVPDPDGGPDILTVYGPTVTPQPIPFSGR